MDSLSWGKLRLKHDSTVTATISHRVPVQGHFTIGLLHLSRHGIPPQPQHIIVTRFSGHLLFPLVFPALSVPTWCTAVESSAARSRYQRGVAIRRFLGVPNMKHVAPTISPQISHEQEETKQPRRTDCPTEWYSDEPEQRAGIKYNQQMRWDKRITGDIFPRTYISISLDCHLQ